jgi:hypothetical protein
VTNEEISGRRSKPPENVLESSRLSYSHQEPIGSPQAVSAQSLIGGVAAAVVPWLCGRMLRPREVGQIKALLRVGADCEDGGIIVVPGRVTGVWDHQRAEPSIREAGRGLLPYVGKPRVSIEKSLFP